MNLMVAVFFTQVSWAAPLSIEIQEVQQTSYKAYLEGRSQDAVSGYRYLVALGDMDPAPTANLALISRDNGQVEEAAAQWLRATLLDPKNIFLWNQRGWNYLALSRYADARDSFKKAIEVSSSSIFTAEAYLGLGLAHSLSGDLKPAFSPLQNACARSPYVLTAASAELGQLAIRLRHFPQAIPFFTMSLSQDPLQIDVAMQLGAAYEKTNQIQAAWQAYKLVRDADPSHEAAGKRMEKIPRYIQGRPIDAMPLRRLARPVLRTPSTELPSDPLRILLFSYPDGKPAHLTRFFFMSSTDFRIADVRLGEVNRAKATVQWELIYRADNRVLELRDVSNNIQFVTKQPFRIEPITPGGSVLLKSPEMLELAGMDPSDREFRGVLEVIPTPMGFHVVNEIPIEEYLFSAVGQALPEGSPPEAYKAMAVLMRSKVLAMKNSSSRNAERTDFCDSAHCLLYPGLTNESAAATQAVRATRGVTIELAPAIPLEHHPSCGGRTVHGIEDRAEPKPAPNSPYELELFLHSYSDPETFDEASAQVPAIWNRWVRILHEEDLRARIEKVKHIGNSIRHVRPLHRDLSGRVLSLQVQGSKETLLLEGEKAISDFLSPGSLRSSAFALQPLYRGKRLERLLVWGAGTGHGRGLCIAGAVGQAHLGRDYRKILTHYFPQAKIMGAVEPPPQIQAPKTSLKKEKSKRKAFPRGYKLKSQKE